MRRVFLSIVASLVLGIAATSVLRPGMSVAAQNHEDQAKVPSIEQLHAHLKQVSKWADSLKGLKVEQAKALFAPMQPQKSTWKYEDQDQPILGYEFPGYDIELYCLPDQVVLVSIDFTPR